MVGFRRGWTEFFHLLGYYVTRFGLEQTLRNNPEDEIIWLNVFIFYEYPSFKYVGESIIIRNIDTNFISIKT